MNYIYKIVDVCNREELKFFDQSLVILEATPVSPSTSSGSCSNFFQDNIVSRIVAVERPKNGAQLYVADGLSTKYHFSCPTYMLPSLVAAIQGKKQQTLKSSFCSTIHGLLQQRMHYGFK